MTTPPTPGTVVRHPASNRTGRVVEVKAAQGKQSRIRSTVKVQFQGDDFGWFRPEDLVLSSGPLPWGGMGKP
jgi:hypothetical protein